MPSVERQSIINNDYNDYSVGNAYLLIRRRSSLDLLLGHLDCVLFSQDLKRVNVLRSERIAFQHSALQDVKLIRLITDNLSNSLVIQPF